MPDLQTFRGVMTQPLPSGDRGVEKTIQLIRDVVDAGVTDPVVNETAIRILQNAGVQNFDREAKLKALYDFVSPPNFLYVEDPVGPFGPKETIRTPRALLYLKAGDCDDYTVLLASLAGTIGIATRAVTVAADPSLPSDFSHIYPEAEVSPGVWVPMDAARPGAQFGLPAHRFFRKRIWSLTDPTYQDVSGMRGAGCGCGCSGRCKSRQRVSSLAGYALLGLGDDASTAQDISAIGQATANIIAAAQGSPYGAFQTAYTPTALPAGYQYSTLPQNTLALSATNPWIWIIGLGLLALAERG